jgi:hypothetical protein
MAGFNPDLQKPAGSLAAIDFTMDKARAGTHPLHFSGHERGTVAHRIAVVQGTLHHHRDDLHVPVGVHAKTLARRYAVVVDHQKRTKTTPLRIMVTGKIEAMPTIKPAALAMKTAKAAAVNQLCIEWICGADLKREIAH